MRITTVIAAALVAVSGSAFAGGFDDAIVIPPPMPVDPEGTGSLGSLGGLGGTAAILGPVALLAILAATQDDDEEVEAST